MQQIFPVNHEKQISFVALSGSLHEFGYFVTSFLYVVLLVAISVLFQLEVLLGVEHNDKIQIQQTESEIC